jgi:hypothetical protein
LLSAVEIPRLLILEMTRDRETAPRGGGYSLRRIYGTSLAQR